MVRLKDIAERAGVSVTTASRVLNGTATEIGISKETQQAVRATAKEMNYRPNREARNLRLGHEPEAILFLSIYEGQNNEEGRGRFFSHPFFGEMMHWIQAEVSKAGYYLAYIAVDGSNLSRIADLIQYTVSGVITWGTPPPKLQKLLSNSELPVAAIEPYVGEEDNLHRVYVDNIDAISQAIKHLVDMGYEQLVMVSLNQKKQNPVFVERVQAFRQLADAYPSVSFVVEELDRPSNISDISVGEIVGKNIVAKMTGTTGVIALNDLIAIGILKVANATGVAVPDQMGIVGIDDIELSKFQTPPLTTVRIHKHTMAVDAVRYITTRLQEGHNVMDPVVKTQVSDF